MGDECATRERGGERRERRTKASFHDALLLYRRALPVNLEQSSPESSEQLSVLVFVMPRRSRADDGPLLVLGDGAERMMRMVHQPEPPAEQQEEEAAPTDDEGSPPDVHALANHVAQGGAADPFAFDGGEERGGEEEEEEQVLEAVEVDGRMAGEEDAAEVEAAEHVVAQGEAADDGVAAQALQEAADTEPEEEAPFERPVVRFVPAARGKGGKKGPKRHQRKVLRYVSHPLTAL